MGRLVFIVTGERKGLSRPFNAKSSPVEGREGSWMSNGGGEERGIPVSLMGLKGREVEIVRIAWWFGKDFWEKRERESGYVKRRGKSGDRPP